MFRPAAGASFNIQYNVANDRFRRSTGRRRQRIRFCRGATVSGPTSGTISYTTTSTPINIAFSGLNSTGVTPDKVDDTTIKAVHHHQQLHRSRKRYGQGWSSSPRPIVCARPGVWMVAIAMTTAPSQRV